MSRALGVSLLAVFVAVGCAGDEKPRNGLIAARSDQGIVLLEEDGTIVRAIPGTKQASEPAWTAAGDRIAYTAGNAIYAVRPDGTERRLLVENASHPTWSPDGERLAFMRDICEQQRSYEDCILELDNPHDLFTVDADGGNIRPLVSDPDFDGNPEWSPDGEWIAYQCGAGSVCLVRPDGTEQRRLAAAPDLGDPSWSPDGESLLAYWNRFDASRASFDIVELDVESGERRVVAERRGLDFAPVSSPDGERLAFLANARCLRTGECTAHEPWEIWVMDSDGGNAKRITEGGFGPLDWAPAVDQ